MNRVPLDQLSVTTFTHLLHSGFRVHASGSAPVEIELVEVTPYRSTREPAGSGNFSVVFAGPPDRFLRQRTYLVEQGKLGAFDLFLVPIGKDERGYRYEAVFNR